MQGIAIQILNRLTEYFSCDEVSLCASGMWGLPLHSSCASHISYFAPSSRFQGKVALDANANSTAASPLASAIASPWLSSLKIAIYLLLLGLAP